MLGTVVPSASRVNGVISMVKFTPDKRVWHFTGIHGEMTVLIRIMSNDFYEVKNHKYINIRHNNSI
jgi:hypothetical protein